MEILHVDIKDNESEQGEAGAESIRVGVDDEDEGLGHSTVVVVVDVRSDTSLLTCL